MWLRTGPEEHQGDKCESRDGISFKVNHRKPVFLWSFGFLFLSLCLCWIRISLSVLLRRISSGRVRCSCSNGPFRSPRVKVSSRKLWPSSRNSTVSRLCWFRQVICSGSSLQRTRPWLSLGGLGSMNVQLHTAACATVLSSKETKGEKMDYEMRWLTVDYDCKPVSYETTCHRCSRVLDFYWVICCVCVSTVAGQEDCWLLTETLVQPVSLQLKVCLNIQCLALHSFTDLHPGKAQGLITVCTPPEFNKSTNTLLVVCYSIWLCN